MLSQSSMPGYKNIFRRSHNHKCRFLLNHINGIFYFYVPGEFLINQVGLLKLTSLVEIKMTSSDKSLNLNVPVIHIFGFVTVNVWYFTFILPVCKPLPIRANSSFGIDSFEFKANLHEKEIMVDSSDVICMLDC